MLKRKNLYYQHRVNKNIPVEEVAGVMGKLIDEGKIRGWGQSQATEEEVRRAHAVTPITAIQSEYSMMERMFEKDVIPACKTLGIGFVPFSPLGATDVKLKREEFEQIETALENIHIYGNRTDEDIARVKDMI